MPIGERYWLNSGEVVGIEIEPGTGAMRDVCFDCETSRSAYAWCAPRFIVNDRKPASRLRTGKISSSPTKSKPQKSSEPSMTRKVRSGQAPLVMRYGLTRL